MPFQQKVFHTWDEQYANTIYIFLINKIIFLPSIFEVLIFFLFSLDLEFVRETEQSSKSNQSEKKCYENICLKPLQYIRCEGYLQTKPRRYCYTLDKHRSEWTHIEPGSTFRYFSGIVLFKLLVSIVGFYNIDGTNIIFKIFTL